MKKSLKILTLVLSLALICGALVVAAFAAEGETLTGIKVVRSANFNGATLTPNTSNNQLAISSGFVYVDSIREGTQEIATDVNGNGYFSWLGGTPNQSYNGYVSTSPTTIDPKKYDSVNGTTTQTGTLDKYDYVVDADVFAPTGKYINGFLKVMVFSWHPNVNSGTRGSFCSKLNVELRLFTDDKGVSWLSWGGQSIALDADSWSHITVALTSNRVADPEGDYLSFDANIWLNGKLVISKPAYGNTTDPMLAAKAGQAGYDKLTSYVLGEVRLQPMSANQNTTTKNDSFACDNVVVQEINKETYNGNLYDVIKNGDKITEWESNNYNKANMPIGNVVATNTTTGKVYDDLQYAIDCANTGDNIELSKDIAYTVNVGKAISIDTKGYTCDAVGVNSYVGKTEDGVISFTYSLPSVKYIKGGVETYISSFDDAQALKDAINGADAGSTVTILKDLELLDCSITISKKLTIDFGGNTIVSFTKAAKTHLFKLGSKAEVTFMTSKEGAQIFHGHDNGTTGIAKFTGNAIFAVESADATALRINGEGLTTYSTVLVYYSYDISKTCDLYIDGGTYVRPASIADNGGLFQLSAFSYVSLKNATFFSEDSRKCLFAFWGNHFLATPEEKCVVEIDNCNLISPNVTTTSFDMLEVTITNSLIAGNIANLGCQPKSTWAGATRDNVPGGTWIIGEGCTVASDAKLESNDDVTVKCADGYTFMPATGTKNVHLTTNTFTTGDMAATKVLTDVDRTISIGKMVASPITFSGAALNIDSYVDMMYYVTIDGEPTAVSAEFTFNGKTTTVTEYTIGEDGRYCFVFEGINPHQMADTIEVTVTATDATGTYTATNDSMSVRAYYELAKEYLVENTALLTLLSDLLVYGAAAQTYVGDTDALVTEGLELTPSTTEFVAPESMLDVRGDAFKSASLYLDHAVTVKFTVEAAEDAVISVAINEKEEFYNVADLEKDENGRYIVVFEDIYSTEYDNAIWATVVGTDDYVRYSVNSYISEMAESEDANLAALVKALYIYGATADAYN